jgi:hypothetical protein
MKRRLPYVAFGVIVLVCVAAAGLYLERAARRADVVATDPKTVQVTWATSPVPDGPGLFFRSTLGDQSFGHVAFVPISAIDGPRYLTSLSCERVYVRTGTGICLSSDFSQPRPYRAHVFDKGFVPGKLLQLTGVPSRARIAPNGRLAAVTVFETGHSYTDAGFSTRTSIIDTTSSTEITDLERFEVRRDNVPFKAVDFNFWGVTFEPDSRHFYATLASRGIIYLVRGDIESRTATVLRQGIECPSLSPDARRLAFKKRVNMAVGTGWRVTILELDSGVERELTAESRSVDDQVDWLDDHHVVYHHTGEHGASIWSLGIDNAAPPQQLLVGGYSPVVVR